MRRMPDGPQKPVPVQRRAHYAGDRTLVGGRVWPEVVARMKRTVKDMRRNQNDFIAAAILMALDDPETLKEALKKVDELDPRRAARANARSGNPQLTLIEQEGLHRSA
jgi:hypothetical protein